MIIKVIRSLDEVKVRISSGWFHLYNQEHEQMALWTHTCPSIFMRTGLTRGRSSTADRAKANLDLKSRSDCPQMGDEMSVLVLTEGCRRTHIHTHLHTHAHTGIVLINQKTPRRQRLFCVEQLRDKRRVARVRVERDKSFSVGMATTLICTVEA